MSAQDAGLSFADVVAVCAANHEFVASFDRLCGCNLSGRGTPLDLAIDRATGREEQDAAMFIEFVHEVVWLRLPLSAFVPGEGGP